MSANFTMQTTNDSNGFCLDPLWDTDLLLTSSWPRLTQCFQDTVLIYVPFGLLWLPLPLYVIDLISTGGTRPLPFTCFSIIKMLMAASIALLSLICIIDDYGQASDFPVSTAHTVANGIRVVSYAAAALLINFERKHQISSSPILFVMWSIASICDIVPLYSKILLQEYKVSLVQFVLFILIYCTQVVQMLFNCFVQSKGGDYYNERVSPEVTASAPSQWFYWWITKTLYTGWRRDLKEADLFYLHPRDCSDSLVSTFENHWVREVARKRRNSERENRKESFDQYQGYDMADLSRSHHSLTGDDEKAPLLAADMNGKLGAKRASYMYREKESRQADAKKKRPSLVRVLIAQMGPRLVVGFIQKFVSDIFLLTGPVILSLLISYADGDADDYVWKGYALAVLLFVSQLFKSILFNNCFWVSQLAGMQMKTILIGAIYKKALTMDNEAKKESTAGEIVNLMSVDCQRVMDVMNFFYFGWGTPIQVIGSFAILYQYIGISSLVGLAVLILTVPLNSYLANEQQKLQRKNLSLKDARLRLTNEAFAGIKVLKLYAWEPTFQEKITEIRNQETKVLLHIAYLNAAISVCFSIAPYLVMLATFAVYVNISEENHLDANKAFVALSYFNLLRVPLALLATIISMSVQAVVSLDRINTFLCTGDLSTDNIRKDDRAAYAVEIENGKFTWDKDTPPSLTNINLRVPEGKLFAVVGPVGTGKSSLVAALLGEMEKLEGRATIKSKVAYVPQQAWIQNATVRDNILFGKPYNKSKYKKVLYACALERDLEILSAGDMTEIGEKGINLSGGQKQRVSLARAVYSNADIYILDDPLSAVDTHVGKHIFTHVIGQHGLLRGKTRVLVTHGVHWLPMVDTVVVMDNGQIVETGSYEDLMAQNGNFANFIRTYLLNESYSSEEDDAEIQTIKSKIRTDVDQNLSDIATSGEEGSGPMKLQRQLSGHHPERKDSLYERQTSKSRRRRNLQAKSCKLLESMILVSPFTTSSDDSENKTLDLRNSDLTIENSSAIDTHGTVWNLWLCALLKQCMCHIDVSPVRPPRAVEENHYESRPEKTPTQTLSTTSILLSFSDEDGRSTTTRLRISFTESVSGAKTVQNEISVSTSPEQIKATNNELECPEQLETHVDKYEKNVDHDFANCHDSTSINTRPGPFCGSGARPKSSNTYFRSHNNVTQGPPVAASTMSSATMTLPTQPAPVDLSDIMTARNPEMSMPCNITIYDLEQMRLQYINESNCNYVEPFYDSSSSSQQEVTDPEMGRIAVTATVHINHSQSAGHDEVNTSKISETAVFPSSEDAHKCDTADTKNHEVTDAKSSDDANPVRSPDATYQYDPLRPDSVLAAHITPHPSKDKPSQSSEFQEGNQSETAGSAPDFASADDFMGLADEAMIDLSSTPPWRSPMFLQFSRAQHNISLSLEPMGTAAIQSSTDPVHENQNETCVEKSGSESHQECPHKSNSSPSSLCNTLATMPLPELITEVQTDSISTSCDLPGAVVTQSDPVENKGNSSEFLEDIVTQSEPEPHEKIPNDSDATSKSSDKAVMQPLSEYCVEIENDSKATSPKSPSPAAIELPFNRNQHNLGYDKTDLKQSDDEGQYHSSAQEMSHAVSQEEGKQDAANISPESVEAKDDSREAPTEPVNQPAARAEAASPQNFPLFMWNRPGPEISSDEMTSGSTIDSGLDTPTGVGWSMRGMRELRDLGLAILRPQGAALKPQSPPPVSLSPGAFRRLQQLQREQQDQAARREALPPPAGRPLPWVHGQPNAYRDLSFNEPNEGFLPEDNMSLSAPARLYAYAGHNEIPMALPLVNPLYGLKDEEDSSSPTPPPFQEEDGKPSTQPPHQDEAGSFASKPHFHREDGNPSTQPPFHDSSPANELFQLADVPPETSTKSIATDRKQCIGTGDTNEDSNFDRNDNDSPSSFHTPEQNPTYCHDNCLCNYNTDQSHVIVSPQQEQHESLSGSVRGAHPSPPYSTKLGLHSTPSSVHDAEHQFSQQINQNISLLQNPNIAVQIDDYSDNRYPITPPPNLTESCALAYENTDNLAATQSDALPAPSSGANLSNEESPSADDDELCKYMRYLKFKDNPQGLPASPLSGSHPKDFPATLAVLAKLVSYSHPSSSDPDLGYSAPAHVPTPDSPFVPLRDTPPEVRKHVQQQNQRQRQNISSSSSSSSSQSLPHFAVSSVRKTKSSLSHENQKQEGHKPFLEEWLDFHSETWSKERANSMADVSNNQASASTEPRSPLQCTISGELLQPQPHMQFLTIPSPNRAFGAQTLTGGFSFPEAASPASLSQTLSPNIPSHNSAFDAQTPPRRFSSSPTLEQHNQVSSSTNRKHHCVSTSPELHASAVPCSSTPIASETNVAPNSIRKISEEKARSKPSQGKLFSDMTANEISNPVILMVGAARHGSVASAQDATVLNTGAIPDLVAVVGHSLEQHTAFTLVPGVPPPPSDSVRRKRESSSDDFPQSSKSASINTSHSQLLASTQECFTHSCQRRPEKGRQHRRVVSTNYDSSLTASGVFQSQVTVYDEDTQSEMIQGKLVQAEKLETGKVKMDVFVNYSKAAGRLPILLAFIFFAIFMIFSVWANFWLNDWTGNAYLANTTLWGTAEYKQTNDYYLGIFGLFGILQIGFLIIHNILYWIRMVLAARRLHEGMLKTIFRSAMSFFDTTPLGRIMNRFSRDIEVVDNTLPMIVRDYLSTACTCLVTLIVISISSPLFLTLVIPIVILYYFIQTFYIPTSRQLKRIESVTRSPIYTHFSETISGGPTIRAYDAGQRFIRESKDRVDRNQSFFYISLAANRWLGMNLELLADVVILGAAVFAVLTPDISGGDVGLSVSYAMQVSSNLVWMVRQMSDLETNIVSVERLKEYSELESEAEWMLPHYRPLPEWPNEGLVQFSNYQTRYRPGLDLVLKGITCEFKAGEKVGIVGRTGAGKSSLALALFRLIESTGGSIIVDGINLADIGLHDVRSHLTILPQDPVLFFGSLRMNLDPLDQYRDGQLWAALARAHLRDFVDSLPEGLEYQVGEEGQSLSVGQRQLVCLARALLKKTKILILDEATAAVDMETDTLIQETIRSEFSNCTIITIAHRINTIMDYDRILVLDAGLIKEFDTPANLLADTQSVFYSMAKEANLVN